MTTPRFAPKLHLEVPKHFGARASVVWLQPGPKSSSDKLDQFGAAQIQHAVALRIRSAILDVADTIEEYARNTQQDYTRLLRVLNGTVIMRLEDIAHADRNLDLGLFGNSRKV